MEATGWAFLSEGTWLQGAYAEVSGCHFACSFARGACGMQNLQAFFVALETTPGSVCVTAEDCTTALAMSRPTSTQKSSSLTPRMPVDFVPFP